mmetsp:Transcript_26198/g.56478  ORF Transcript_26198/g.56478 Transcript_26198/m.56478 type:complete len:141 (+) Transcript_26198:43-465(+)
MIIRSAANLLARKLITLPRLSPTHTSSRLVQRLVPSGSHVIEYQPVMTVQCSSDMIADPADRVTQDHQQIMLLEIMEEGSIKWNSESVEAMEERNEWVKVGTIIGEVSDGSEEDEEDGVEIEEWAWQAYLHDNDEGEVLS